LVTVRFRFLGAALLFSLQLLWGHPGQGKRNPWPPFPTPAGRAFFAFFPHGVGPFFHDEGFVAPLPPGKDAMFASFSSLLISSKGLPFPRVEYLFALLFLPARLSLPGPFPLRSFFVPPPPTKKQCLLLGKHSLPVDTCHLFPDA